MRPLLESADLNESDTRLRIIDTILFDILGWDKLAVSTELYCREAGFADYVFIENGKAGFILEAKRTESYFSVPKRNGKVKPTGFALLTKESEAADSALKQVIKYAMEQGPRYVAISNGHQWILCLAYIQGQALTERSLLVFDSLECIDDNFREFYDSFSPKAISLNLPSNLLLEGRKAPAPAKLTTYIVDYPHPASRNQIANELGLIAGIVLNDTKDREADKSFLEECYVKAKENAASILQAEELVKARLQTDERIKMNVWTQDNMDNYIRQETPSKPVIVLGKIGHGKSTFLNYLRTIKAPETLTRFLQIIVNFIDRPDNAAEVGEYVYDQIFDQLRDTHNIDVSENNMVRTILDYDIKQFRKTPEGSFYEYNTQEYRREELELIKSITRNKYEYLKRVFRFLKTGSKFSLAVFFDNLDKRPIEVQEEAFLKASAIARDCASLTFVCLRPESYYKSKHFGVLDSVSPKVFTISSPNPKLLITKRLRYAKKFATGDTLPMGAGYSQNITYNLKDVADLLECCVASFQFNKNLPRLFNAVSNGNARKMLDTLYQLLVSNHLNTDKILKNYRNGKYIIPIHEVLRAVLYSDYLHYDSRKSVFINFYDIERSDKMEHFTRYIVVSYLYRTAPSYSRQGYCSHSETKKYLYQLGYTDRHVYDTLSYLYQKKYIESNMPTETLTEQCDQLRITPLGRYHVQWLLPTFVYFDAIVIDTPIIDDAMRNMVSDTTDIFQRLERTEVFLEYLDQCALSVADGSFREAWRDTVEMVKQEVSHVRASAIKHARQHK